MRKVIKFRPYIFLVCCCAFLFVSCNSDELNEDLPNEEVIENITGASFGKYQQLSIDEVTGFVDGIQLVLTATTQKYRNKRTICNNWQKLCQQLLIFC